MENNYRLPQIEGIIKNKYGKIKTLKWKFTSRHCCLLKALSLRPVLFMIEGEIIKSSRDTKD